MIPARASAVRYVIDTRVSQFTVQAFANGLVAAIAHSPKIAIRDWTGEVQMASGTLADAFLMVQIKAASLEVLDELRDADRREIHRIMNQEVLETAKFPEVVFESQEVKSEKVRDDLYKVNVRGQLSLHGLSQSHTFGAQVSFGDGSFRAYGDFIVRQTDYDIRIASIAGGTLKLQDDLKFSFYVLAHKEG